MGEIDHVTARYIHETYLKPLQARLNSHSKKLVLLEGSIDESNNVLRELKYEVKTLTDTVNRWGKIGTYLGVGFVLPALATLLVLGFKTWINKP